MICEWNQSKIVTCTLPTKNNHIDELELVFFYIAILKEQYCNIKTKYVGHIIKYCF